MLAEEGRRAAVPRPPAVERERDVDGRPASQRLEDVERVHLRVSRDCSDVLYGGRGPVSSEASRGRRTPVSAARCSTRSGFVRKRSSSGSSASPTASHSERNSRSFAAEIISAPSLVSNTSYGAMSGNAVPWGPGTEPSARWRVRW
jgi:hypothetical protein